MGLNKNNRWGNHYCVRNTAVIGYSLVAEYSGMQPLKSASLSNRYGQSMAVISIEN